MGVPRCSSGVESSGEGGTDHGTGGSGRSGGHRTPCPGGHNDAYSTERFSVIYASAPKCGRPGRPVMDCLSSRTVDSVAHLPPRTSHLNRPRLPRPRHRPPRRPPRRPGRRPRRLPRPGHPTARQRLGPRDLLPGRLRPGRPAGRRLGGRGLRDRRLGWRGVQRRGLADRRRSGGSTSTTAISTWWKGSWRGRSRGAFRCGAAALPSRRDPDLPRRRRARRQPVLRGALPRPAAYPRNSAPRHRPDWRGTAHATLAYAKANHAPAGRLTEVAGALAVAALQPATRCSRRAASGSPTRSGCWSGRACWASTACSRGRRAT